MEAQYRNLSRRLHNRVRLRCTYSHFQAWACKADSLSLSRSVLTPFRNPADANPPERHTLPHHCLTAIYFGDRKSRPWRFASSVGGESRIEWCAAALDNKKDNKRGAQHGSLSGFWFRSKLKALLPLPLCSDFEKDARREVRWPSSRAFARNIYILGRKSEGAGLL